MRSRGVRHETGGASAAARGGAPGRYALSLRAAKCGGLLLASRNIVMAFQYPRLDENVNMANSGGGVIDEW